MSRGSQLSIVRAAAVWVSVTAMTGGALSAAVPLLAGASWTAAASFPDLLVQISALALAAAVLRLWVVTTVTVGRLLAGRTPRADGLTRRLVLGACGAALAAGVTSPASATEGDRLLEGLRLPDRAVTAPAPATAAVSPPLRAATKPASDVHVVRGGESLWSIAAATSPAGTALDDRWRSIWAANRDVVGDDPDLILPGQRLRIPQPGDDTTDETGDRP